MLKNIFFLHSNEFVALSVKEALKKQGVDCYTLGTTRDCFYLISDLKPELIILDADLFRTEGAAFLKGLEANALKPVLVLSGSAQDWDELGLKAPWLGLLAKPLAPFQLLEKLSALSKLQ